MSKRETLDYLKLCSNYYSNYEDETCMESCEYYNHNECPVVYVNGLISELQEQLALTEKALELACEEINRVEEKFGSAYIRANGYLVDYFKTKAKEMMKSE